MYKRNDNEKLSSRSNNFRNQMNGGSNYERSSVSSSSSVRNRSVGSAVLRTPVQPPTREKTNLRFNDKTINSSSSSSKHSNSSSISSLNSKQRRALARERWTILKKAILNKTGSFKSTSSSSVRRFNSFGLIKSVKIAYVDQSHTRNGYNNQQYDLNNNYKNRYAETDSNDDDDDDICVSNKPRPRLDKQSKMNNNKHIDQKLIQPYQWYEMSVPSIEPDEFVKVRFYNGPVSLNDMIGFNNTGNICLWPSEEIMTYFCVKNSVIFDNKSVCELGGGMTCLGGLMISKCSKPKEVFLTDGNETSFENLEVICSQNEFECSVECCLLQWNKDTNYGDLEERFDYIICADCLFFDEFREDLCATIYKLLKMDGMCLIFAPNRQNTFHKFVDMAKLNFECMIVHDYDMEIWEKHLNEKENNEEYEEDIHYPLLLKLKKRTKANNDFCKMVL